MLRHLQAKGRNLAGVLVQELDSFPLRHAIWCLTVCFLEFLSWHEVMMCILLKISCEKLSVVATSRRCRIFVLRRPSHLKCVTRLFPMYILRNPQGSGPSLDPDTTSHPRTIPIQHFFV